MEIFLEVFFSLMRIFLLLSGLALSVTLGSALYGQVNSFLYTISLPCLEVISMLVLFAPPIAFYFGITHKKYFWQRQNHYNLILFLVSFAVGIIFTLLPLEYAPAWATGPQCVTNPDLFSRVVQLIGTGLITALFAYLGMDIGVSFKHISHRVRAKKHKKS